MRKPITTAPRRGAGRGWRSFAKTFKGEVVRSVVTRPAPVYITSFSAGDGNSKNVEDGESSEGGEGGEGGEGSEGGEGGEGGEGVKVVKLVKVAVWGAEEQKFLLEPPIPVASGREKRKKFRKEQISSISCRLDAAP